MDYFVKSKAGKKSLTKKFNDAFNGKTNELISRFPDKKGRMIWMESFINPILIKDQKTTEISLIAHNITENIEYQQRIKLSEANNRAILLAMPDTLIKVNNKGLITDANINPEGEIILSRITKKTEIVGCFIQEIIKEQSVSDEIMSYVHRTLETNQVLKNTFIADKGREHNKIYLENRYSKTNDEEVIIVVRNVTDAVEFEETLKEAVIEKETLLKEVHHRVKNNLQVINSILNLQSSYVDDEKTLEIINESQNRIRSMAYIHEILYQTTDFSSIKFKEYITNLIQNLVQSYEPYNNKTIYNKQQ